MKTKHFLTLALIAALISSCMQKEEYFPLEGEGIPISVAGAINQESTKVNEYGFEDGDALGLYAVNYTDENRTPGTLLSEGNQADHIRYILDEVNRRWKPVRRVYYKDVKTNVDLYVYYPFAEPESTEAYNFEVEKDQSIPRKGGKLAGYEASDFLWGKAENVTPTEDAIKVSLSHKMAGVRATLKQGTGFEEGEFDRLEKILMVTGTTRKASINLSTGVATPIGEAQQTGILMSAQSDGSFRAIVVPQTAKTGTEILSLTIDGIAYNYTLKEDFTFQPGKISDFEITLNRKGHSGEYELALSNTQITDWKEDLATYEDKARQYYCVNMTKPGTLGKLIKGNNKNPDKIRNLKVSGYISDEDFKFMRDSMEILEAVNLKESRVVECAYGQDIWGYDQNGNWTIVGSTDSKDDVIPREAFHGKKSLYYFTFPEKITEIQNNAFDGTRLSGALIIPDDVNLIGSSAFSNTSIYTVTFSPKLKRIEDNAFSSCSNLAGTLVLPESLSYIGQGAFSNCGFSGSLHLPESIDEIGGWAFQNAGKFTGNLTIPPKVSKLEPWTFSQAGFTGILDLQNVSTVGEWCFYDCKFKGELAIPEGLTEIGNYALCNNEYTTIHFPSTLKIIGENSFSGNWRLTGDLIFPEGLVSIAKNAFSWCQQLNGVHFPSTLQTIQSGAFDGCSYITKIVSVATEPPYAQTGAFNGVAKDNFTLEVPESAVVRYQADAVWGDFRRIAAHHDFSISRPLARALNAETSRKFVLRAPANFSWSIESKPDWITVTPASGTGKVEVTVTFKKMELNDVWGSNLGYNMNGEAIRGREGEIVFMLDGKDYRTKMKVEQYDYEYNDGDVVTLNEATKGAGVNVVFLGDCYDAKDIATGTYLADLKEGVEHYFAVEPYKTYREYFNVYGVFGVSGDSGVGTVNTVKDAAFGSQYALNGVVPDEEACYEYAAKAIPNLDPSKTLIVLIENTTEYGGICYMWYDNSAIACCPKSTDPYPYDFRGLIQHEAGGHGFGKLGDEYIYHNAFIASCTCNCCPHLYGCNGFLAMKDLGWYRNLEATGDMNQVGWSHLIFHEKYSDVVDMYEGGFFHSRGIYRSEATSCMNNNIPYFSAISRQAIVERIMEYAGEEFTLEKFYANDKNDVNKTNGENTKAGANINIATGNYGGYKQHAPVIKTGKPNFRRN